MRVATLFSSFIPVLLVSCLSACQADEQSELDLYAAEFADPGTTFRADGILEMTVYDGDNTDSPECIIWDIKGPPPSGSDEDGSVTDVVTGEKILDVFGDEFRLPDGTVTCQRVANLLESTQEVRIVGGEEQNEVVFTVWGRWVFDGQLNLSGKGPLKKLIELATKLRFTFQDDQIFDGPAFHGDVLVTATEDVQNTSTTQKLLLAALIDGECGAPGLPAPDPDHDY